MIENEIAVMQQARHDNIVKLMNYSEDEKHYFIVTDLCNAGDLSTFLKLHKRLNEKLAKIIIKQII